MNIIPYTRKVHFYETDQMSIVHHSNYIRWFEEARVDFLEQVGHGYDKAVSSGIDFVLTGISCEYKSMVRFGETVKIYLNITHLEPFRITVTYEVVDDETGTLRATGTSKHCSFHRRRNRPVSLKKEMPELYEVFEQITKTPDA